MLSMLPALSPAQSFSTLKADGDAGRAIPKTESHLPGGCRRNQPKGNVPPVGNWRKKGCRRGRNRLDPCVEMELPCSGARRLFLSMSRKIFGLLLLLLSRRISSVGYLVVFSRLFASGSWCNKLWAPVVWTRTNVAKTSCFLPSVVVEIWIGIQRLDVKCCR